MSGEFAAEMGKNKKNLDLNTMFLLRSRSHASFVREARKDDHMTKKSVCGCGNQNLSSGTKKFEGCSPRPDFQRGSRDAPKAKVSNFSHMQSINKVEGRDRKVGGKEGRKKGLNKRSGGPEMLREFHILLSCPIPIPIL